MATASITVGSLINRLAFIIEGKETASTALRAAYLAALQEALDDLVRDRPAVDRLRAEGVINTVAGTSDYTLPDSCNQLITSSVYLAQSGNHNHLNYIELSRPESGRYAHLLETEEARPYAFSVLGATSSGNVELRLFPTPDAVYQVNFRYYAWPDRFDTDIDGTTVIDRRIPRTFLMPLVSGAIVMHFPNRVTSQELQVHFSTWERVKTQWRHKDRVNQTQTHRIQSTHRQWGYGGRDRADDFVPGTGKTPGW